MFMLFDLRCGGVAERAQSTVSVIVCVVLYIGFT
jgi:hypothetical protein